MKNGENKDNGPEKGKKRLNIDTSDSSGQKTLHTRGSTRKAKVTTRRDLKEFLKNNDPPETTASQPQQKRGRPAKKAKKAKSQSPEKKKPPIEKTRPKESEKNNKKKKTLRPMKNKQKMN